MKTVLHGLAGVLIVAGVLVAIASFFSPGQVIHGIDAGLAGTLLAGGGIVLALAWLNESVAALDQTLSRALRHLDTTAPSLPETAVAAIPGPAAVPSPGPREERLSGYGPTAGEDTLAAPSAVAEEPSRETVAQAPESPPTEPDTPPAADLAPESLSFQTIEVVEEVEEVVVVEAAPAPDEPLSDTPPVIEETETGAGEELYVVEEREFRGKPARVLSDGTVEAETDEGWMRFENMEHLEEYMDAMDAMASGRG